MIPSLMNPAALASILTASVCNGFTLGAGFGGNWDLAQVCDHLAFFMRASLDGLTFRVPWLLKVLFGRFVLRRILKRRRMKDRAPTPQKPLPTAGGDEAAAVARLKQVIGRLQAHSGELRDSPFFGYFSPEQWRELHLIHWRTTSGSLPPRNPDVENLPLGRLSQAVLPRHWARCYFSIFSGYADFFLHSHHDVVPIANIRAATTVSTAVHVAPEERGGGRVRVETAPTTWRRAPRLKDSRPPTQPLRIPPPPGEGKNRHRLDVRAVFTQGVTAMTLRFWNSKWFGSQKRKPLANGRRSAGKTVRLALEWLEDRVVPSHQCLRRRDFSPL